MATPVYPYTQYSGIWTMQQVNAAIAAGTWPVPNTTLFAWGYGGYGSLGLGNSTSYSSPKQVSNSSWKNVSITAFFVVATKQDGSLWSWGANSNGQLGLGNTTGYSSPKQVGSLTSWLSVAACQYHSLAVKTDGTLWSWGYNSTGQLGLGNVTSYSSPKQVGALTTWSKVFSGYNSSYAIKTDGTLWSWGIDTDGVLGLGAFNVNKSSPNQIGSATNWVYVRGGDSSAIGLQSDGTLWTWGNGLNGRLGLGNTTAYNIPKKVGSLTNWSSISNGNDFCVAVRTDGTAWAWGYGGLGALGQGSTTSFSSPVQIGALTNWSQITASRSGAGFSVKTDKTLWAWGWGGNGQLGQGSTANISSPVQVGASTNWLSVAAGQYVVSALQS